MMRIDTSHLAGWEDKTVVLEFEHGMVPELNQRDGTPTRPELWGCRATQARLVEFRDVQVQPPADSLTANTAWRPVASGGWKRTLCQATAVCSPADQFCRETGRRVAIRKLAAIKGRATYGRLRAAAIRQYFENRAALKRKARP